MLIILLNKPLPFKSRMDPNKLIYEDKKIVEEYSNENHLQPPEQSIFQLIKEKLPEMNFLDIGVGAGRTTHHFAPVVKSYVGIDYSNAMITICKSKFNNFTKNVTFKNTDARDLSTFENNSFDFVLFSFNGIDYVSANDRNIILKQIKTILKNDGFFCFSTHNLQSLESYYKFIKYRDIKSLIKEMKRYLTIRIKNPSVSKLLNSDFTFFKDEAHNFRLNTYYCKPLAQIEELKALGFRSIQVFDLKGKEIPINEYSINKDPWVYFLCNIQK